MNCYNPSVASSFEGNLLMSTPRDLLYTNKRKIYFNTEINSDSATSLITQLEYLDDLSNDDITLVIDSPGGSVNSGFEIIDVINSIKSDVSIVCAGICASMAAVILSSGTKGKRLAYSSSEIMIHQPHGEICGQASDIELTAKHILSLKEKINKLLAGNTGKTIKEIRDDTERDKWFTAYEAFEYGIVDRVIE